LLMDIYKQAYGDVCFLFHVMAGWLL